MTACMKITRERRAVEIPLSDGSETDFYHKLFKEDDWLHVFTYYLGEGG